MSAERLAAAINSVVDARLAWLESAEPQYESVLVKREEQANDEFDAALVERVTEIVAANTARQEAEDEAIHQSALDDAYSWDAYGSSSNE